MRDAFFALLIAPILVAAFRFALDGPLHESSPGLSIAWGVASLVWVVAVVIAYRGGGKLAPVIAGAIALRIILIVATPGLSDDAYRYVWEGELVTRGTSPYAWTPDDPELVDVRVELPGVYETLNNKEVSAAYPPLTQAAGAGAVWIAKSRGWKDVDQVLAMRILYGLFDLLCLWPLGYLLTFFKKPLSLLVVWGWSPLVALEFAGSGHFDSLGIFLLLSAVAILGPATRGGASAFFGWLALCAAILVKFLPLCALPFVLRTRRWFFKLLGVGLVLVAAYLPLAFMHGRWQGLFDGLGEYGLRWESTNILYRWIEPVWAEFFEPDSSWTDPRRLGRFTVAFVWLVWGIFALRAKLTLAHATGTMIAAFLVLTPTLHPWYITWVLPFVALRPGRTSAAWIWLAAAAPLLYWPLEGWHTHGEWVEPDWLWPVVALPFLALLLFSRRQRRAP